MKREYYNTIRDYLSENGKVVLDQVVEQVQGQVSRDMDKFAADVLDDINKEVAKRIAKLKTESDKLETTLNQLAIDAVNQAITYEAITASATALKKALAEWKTEMQVVAQLPYVGQIFDTARTTLGLKKAAEKGS